MPKKIAAFGELLWDILPNGKVLGGAPANFIYRINSFGDEGTLLSKVGNDKAGKDAREAIRKLGLSDENIQTDYEFPTGSVKIKIDSKGLLGLKSKNLKDLAREVLETFKLEIIICTLGSYGAFCLTQDYLFHYDPGYQISLGDTVGAGDAFSSGFVHYYMNGEEIENALCFGNAAGAIVATTTGATSPVSKAQILDFMAIPNNRNNVRFHQ